MKKIILLTLGGLLLLALAVLGTGYALSYRISAVELPQKAALIAPPDGAATGEAVRFVFEVKLPLRASLRGVEAELPEQLVLSGTPEIRCSGYFFTRLRYRVTVSAAVLDAGAIPEGKLRMATDVPLAWTPQEVITPAFSAAKADAALQVMLADAMPPKTVSFRQYYWIGGAGLLVLLLILGALRERSAIRARERALSIQEIAIAEIAELRRSLGERQSPENVFGRLSNLVRVYLEQRFGLPLSRSTTEEFFGSAQQKAQIPDAQRPFLAGFLRTADMVKFARASAAPEAVREALDSAEKLVQATSAPEKEEEK